MSAPPLVRLRRGHDKPITALTVGPGGELVWTGDEAGRIVGWDSRVGVPRHELRCQSSVLSLAASADGSRLAVGRLEGPGLVYHDGPGAVGRASPAGAAPPEPFAAVKALMVDGAFEPAAAVAWSADGELVATGSGGYTATRFPITLWHASGDRVRVLDRHRYRVRALAFSPDGELLASGSDDDSVIVWRVFSGEPVGTCALGQDVVALAWSLDGARLLAGAYDTVTLLDRRAERVGGWKGAIVRALSVCPDGKHLAVAGLRYGGPGALEIRTLEGAMVHEAVGGDDVAAVGYLPDGQLATAAGPTARVHWGPSCRLALSDPVRRPISLATMGDRLLVGGTDGRARVVSARDPCERRLEATPDQWLARMAASPDGRRVALASAGGEGKLVDGESGALVAALPQKAEQWALAWSRDGSRFAVGGHDGVITIRDGVTGSVVREIALDGVRFQCAVFSADGARLYVGATDGVLRIWDAASGEGLANQRCSRASLCAVAVSPDGRLLATGGEDASLRLYEEATGKRLGQVVGPRLAVNDVRFSADGSRLLAASGDGAVYLCRVDPLTVERKLEAHEGIVASALFWLGDRLAASAGTDGQLVLWQVATGERIATLHHVGDRSWLVTAADGRFDVDAGAIGAVMVDRGAERVDGLWAERIARA